MISITTIYWLCNSWVNNCKILIIYLIPEQSITLAFIFQQITRAKIIYSSIRNVKWIVRASVNLIIYFFYANHARLPDDVRKKTPCVYEHRRSERTFAFYTEIFNVFMTRTVISKDLGTTNEKRMVDSIVMFLYPMAILPYVCESFN